MANKRDLKKQVRYLCGDMASKCMIAVGYLEGVDDKALVEIVGKIAHLQQNVLSSMSFSFDKSHDDFATLRQYNDAKARYNHHAYNVLCAKFNSRIVELIAEMNKAVPSNVRPLIMN